jgi:hypothetical protein
MTSDFVAIGRLVLDLLDDEGMLRSGVDVLHVDCGCGRGGPASAGDAAALVRRLRPAPGDDCVGPAEISSRDQRFTFEHLDNKSAYDEWDGHSRLLDASELSLPYAARHDQLLPGRVPLAVDNAGFVSRYRASHGSEPFKQVWYVLTVPTLEGA